ncbi:MAG TPA: energy transducer TonB, partial [Polyangiaceae bacterium]
DCGFPAEADIEGINYAVVTLAVTVGSDGRAKSVTVVKDPGYGFGKLARTCAVRKPYITALDPYGKPLTRTTPPFNVRFER